MTGTLDINLVYYRDLTDEERAVYDALPHGLDNTLTIEQTFVLYILREISQARAVAKERSGRLKSLVTHLRQEGKL